MGHLLPQLVAHPPQRAAPCRLSARSQPSQPLCQPSEQRAQARRDGLRAAGTSYSNAYRLGVAVIALAPSSCCVAECVSRWLFASIDLVRALCLDVVHVHIPSLFPFLPLSAPESKNTRNQDVQRLNKFPRGRFGKFRRSTARGFIEAQATCPALRVGA
jgi:hypothetical protein